MAVEARHFTVEQFHGMVESNIISPADRVELLEGIVINMAPIGPFHVGVTAQLSRFLTLAGPDHWLVMTQMPVRLSEDTEFQPDIMLVPLELETFKTRVVSPADVHLLIEVSDTTVRYDRERKLPLYAEAGIREVWIVNLDDRLIEVHREPSSSGYRNFRQVRPGETASPLAFPHVGVEVADLFARIG